MKYFSYLNDKILKLFYKEPTFFDRDSEREILANALGATLYIPGSKKELGQYIINKRFPALMSLVVCFEDSIGEDMVEECQDMLAKSLGEIRNALQAQKLAYEDIPLIFLRVKELEQMQRIIHILGDNASLITGFVLPKVTSANLTQYLTMIEQMSIANQKRFYAMPILESSEIIYKETRLMELSKVSNIIEKYKHMILNIRLGGTDFCKFFGLRRRHTHTLYDIHLVSDCICDITNVFLREDRDFVISGPVWEYFNPNSVAFDENHLYTRGLINEIILDKENGLIGKTVIHPSHIKIVHALQIVEFEEYMDALSILSQDKRRIGASPSQFSNKMNENKPHSNWARKVIKRAEIFGVLNEGENYKSIVYL